MFKELTCLDHTLRSWASWMVSSSVMSSQPWRIDSWIWRFELVMWWPRGQPYQERSHWSETSQQASQVNHPNKNKVFELPTRSDIYTRKYQTRQVRQIFIIIKSSCLINLWSVWLYWRGSGVGVVNLCVSVIVGWVSCVVVSELFL